MCVYRYTFICICMSIHMYTHICTYLYIHMILYISNHAHQFYISRFIKHFTTQLCPKLLVENVELRRQFPWSVQVSHQHVHNEVVITTWDQGITGGKAWKQWPRNLVIRREWGSRMTINRWFWMILDHSLLCTSKMRIDDKTPPKNYDFPVRYSQQPENNGNTWDGVTLENGKISCSSHISLGL